MKKNWLFSILAVVLMWLVWLIAYPIVRNDYLLPSVEDTAVALWRLLSEAAFWHAFAGTLVRTLGAFCLAFVSAFVFAALASVSDMVRSFFAPIVSVLRTVPTMAIILVLLLWTSHSTAPVIVSLLVLFPALYAAMLASLDEVRMQYGRLAKAFKVSPARKIFKLYLPLAAPSVLAQSGSVLSMGLKITVSGEVLAQTYRSLGGMMQDAQLGLNISVLFALTVLVIAVGFALEGLFLLVGKGLVRWRS